MHRVASAIRRAVVSMPENEQRMRIHNWQELDARQQLLPGLSFPEIYAVTLARMIQPYLHEEDEDEEDRVLPHNWFYQLRNVVMGHGLPQLNRDRVDREGNPTPATYLTSALEIAQRIADEAHRLDEQHGAQAAAEGDIQADIEAMIDEMAEEAELRPVTPPARRRERHILDLPDDEEIKNDD